MIVKKVNNENAYSLNVLTQTVVNCKFDSYGSNSFNYYVSYLHIKCWIIITNRIFIHCLYDIYKNISLISGLIIPWLICYDAQVKKSLMNKDDKDDREIVVDLILSKRSHVAKGIMTSML